MRSRALILASQALFVGCTDALVPVAAPPLDRFVLDLERPLPERLVDWGLFAGGDLRGREPAEDVLEYSPPFALYSGGAEKERLVYLPPGKVIDGMNSEMYIFPVGTVFAKTFTFNDLRSASGRAGQIPVETRLLFRREAGWDFAVYHWSAAGDDARQILDPLTGPGPTGDAWYARRLSLTGPLGGDFEYEIPSRRDCGGCHETRADRPVLGVSAWLLDPRLVDAGLFSSPPHLRPTAGRTPLETEVQGYVAANCAFCHHGQGGTDNASFSLRPEDLIANTVNRETESSASGFGVRVVPGQPEESALFEAVVRARELAYDGDFKPMPPLGLLRSDPEAERLLRDWISSLPSDDEPR